MFSVPAVFMIFFRAFPAGTVIPLTSQITRIKNGFSAVEFSGEDCFEEFLENGGASDDKGVLAFVTKKLLSGGESATQTAALSFSQNTFGCSAVSVRDSGGENNFLTGRNFDWHKCDALIVVSKPARGYASVSTVNADFVKSGSGMPRFFLKDSVLTFAALYAPLDGMNEQGLCVAVNMISDSATIDQNTAKTDVTTTTAIRLLLNSAADVDDAVALLRKYDMHASMNFMVHFFISDSSGKSVAVEYVDDVMSVIETPILTNSYLSHGRKFGIGTPQSHIRFEMLKESMTAKSAFDVSGVQALLESVAKKNFTGFESTEWSVVFDRKNLCAVYCHREDFGMVYKINLK